MPLAEALVQAPGPSLGPGNNFQWSLTAERPACNDNVSHVQSIAPS